RDCEINTLGTLNILKLCAKYKVSKLVYASSAAVYGSAKEMPLKEEHHILSHFFLRTVQIFRRAVHSIIPSTVWIAIRNTSL
ncbi:NAD-dependent epimerase/dehydratase family protein, partial [Leptospira santarosai]|nr:NAD-dependent epimerase/dehydratase family protein [Leptospira santarosai]